MGGSTNGSQYRAGMIVTHLKKPEWGPGSVQVVQRNQIALYPPQHPLAQASFLQVGVETDTWQ